MMLQNLKGVPVLERRRRASFEKLTCRSWSPVPAAQAQADQAGPSTDRMSPPALNAKARREERGATLPAALWALAVGALVMAPFLGHLSTSLLGGKNAHAELLEQYSADASIEFAIWKLLNDQTYRNSVDVNPGTPVSIAPPVTVNGITSSTSAEANTIGIWNDMTYPAVPFEAGAALAHDGGDYIYALVGNNTDQFMRYSISGNSWTVLNDTPKEVDHGGSLAHDGGNFLYALRGNNKNDFWRYSISGDSWAKMKKVPAKVEEGGALVYAGGDYLFALRGSNKKGFWRYSISDDKWKKMEKAPGKVKDGGALVFAGGDYLFAFRGGNKNDFWRYSISGDSWSTMANTLANVDGGGALAHPGGDYLYAFRGDASTDFWRYQISQDFWIPLESAPASADWGGALAHSFGPDIFALRGDTQNTFWRFSITPPEYDLTTSAVGHNIDVHIQINGSTVTVEDWDIK